MQNSVYITRILHTNLNVIIIIIKFFLRPSRLYDLLFMIPKNLELFESLKNQVEDSNYDRSVIDIR